MAMGWVILNTNFELSSYSFSPNEPLPLLEKFSRRLQAGLSGERVAWTRRLVVARAIDRNILEGL